MAVHDLSDLNHAPELAQAIGNMVVAWSRAESSMVFALAAATDMALNLAVQAYYRVPNFEARHNTKSS